MDTASGSPKRPLYQPPPTIAVADAALKELSLLLRPRRKWGRGYLPFTAGSDRVQQRLGQMEMFLAAYVRSGSTSEWSNQSLCTAVAHQKGLARARILRKWTRDFIADHHALPCPVENTWSTSLLDQRPDLKVAICDHLLGLGKYVRAVDIVHFMLDPANMVKHGLTKPVCLSTAQTWMHALDYRWTKVPSGQFVDGHERGDVVAYRQSRFLPEMARSDPHAREWDNDGNVVPVPGNVPRPLKQTVVYWWHDESVFYAHDRRQTRWVHKSEKAVPRAKGEGASLMVADFVSADYGWLRSPDGKESARVLFKPGKNRDGYFTHEEILSHATTAMDILQRHYPHEHHILIFDNAPTHLKRAADALSARHMSKFPTHADKPMFGVEANVLDVVSGKPVYGRDGKLLKRKVRMEHGTLPNGQRQSLYFEAGHPREGVFKGMAQILEERGYADARKLLAQCPEFKCKPPAKNCCCRRLLFNEPDFRDVETLLETHCRGRGVDVLFLPKFHCELNCIEQCWGHAKRTYRKFPPSSAEADLERNVVAALDAVPLVSIRRFYTRAHQFMDAYRRGLDGLRAAWAAKKTRNAGVVR
ncbi:hypothetical protein OH76DRAFT_1477023 [Lentinus brumalis]|uniref:Uncharacterized protein n=1 Tax=Lentinus brumalis TaxID=2498619 RepID=A0A371DV41_9APHY|nr:hypothetical protein OH76DRAFT_1477023 [Polyporus brumalis]